MLNEQEESAWERRMREIQEGNTMRKGISMEEAMKIARKMSEEGMILVEKPTPMEILEDLMGGLKAKFDEAAKGNDYVTILKYSEAITNVAKGITDLQGSKAAYETMDRMIAEMRDMLRD